MAARGGQQGQERADPVAVLGGVPEHAVGIALFQQDSYDDVAENLVGALEGMHEAIPNRSFTQAR